MEEPKRLKPKKRVRILSKIETILDIEDYKKMVDLALSVAKQIISDAVQALEDEANPIKNIRWITHGEFTAEGGRLHIEEFISTWECQDRWVHYSEFVAKKDVEHSFYYIYYVRWSEPTARRPILELSAGAQFTIKFTKGKPSNAPVDVFYSFEDQSLVHRPGTSRFKAVWLRDIIDGKRALIESGPI